MKEFNFTEQQAIASGMYNIDKDITRNIYGNSRPNAIFYMKPLQRNDVEEKRVDGIEVTIFQEKLFEFAVVSTIDNGIWHIKKDRIDRYIQVLSREQKAYFEQQEIAEQKQKEYEQFTHVTIEVAGNMTIKDFISKVVKQFDYITTGNKTIDDCSIEDLYNSKTNSNLYKHNFSGGNVELIFL